MKAKVAKLIAGRRRRKFQGFWSANGHATRAMLALVLALLWPSSSVSYTELAPQQYNNGSVELLHGTTIIRGPGNVHGGALMQRAWQCSSVS